MDAEVAWSVPEDHPAFAGHFPGRPIVPGVVLLDRAIALAEVHFRLSLSVLQISSAKFFSPVLPGDALVFALDLRPSDVVEFVVRRGDQDVAAGSLRPRGR